MRTISLPTGNAWNHQWYDPGDVKNVCVPRTGACTPNPWARGTRGRRPSSQYNAGRGDEGHTLPHG